MVIFCKKSAATPLTFRAPVTADYMGSKFRQTYLVPKQEIDTSRFEPIEKGGRRFLLSKETHLLGKYQDRAALEHWNIMRHVLPDLVWENW